MERRQFLKGIAGLAACVSLPVGVAKALTPSDLKIDFVELSEDKKFLLDTKATTIGSGSVFGEERLDTKELVSLMKEVMKKNSEEYLWNIKEGRPYPELSDVYISREAMQDIRNWGVDEIDETTRKEILSGGLHSEPFKGVNISIISWEECLK